MCYNENSVSIEDTYKSIKRRNLVNEKDNPVIKLIAKLLKIPSDENGNFYIEFDIPKNLQIGNISKRKVYPFTSEYYSYLAEFQTNSIYSNFMCMNKENQQAILYLTKALYYNLQYPELFINPDID